MTFSKPQNLFSFPIDNSRDQPFIPRIKTKPYAIVPLDLSLHKSEDSMVHLDHSYSFDGGFLSSEDNNLICTNPYEIELNELKYTDYQLGINDTNERSNSKNKPILSKSIQNVTTLIQLQVVCDIILSNMNTKEVGVSLFEHTYRSFQGFTCIISLATKDSIYIIDALSLRDAISEVLGLIFANPNIVKVFHNCSHDILCLQRDFGIYTVNCFDTYLAAKFLRYPNLQLDHSVKFHFGINNWDESGKVQSESINQFDWRVRPVSDNMLIHAKNQVSYLTDLYVSFRSAIYSKYGREGVEAIFESARKYCLQHYTKPIFNIHGYLSLLETRNIDFRSLSVEQKAVFMALWEWRDRVARQIDESLEYVMPTSTYLQISINIPMTLDKLEGLCPPSAELLLSRKDEIVLIISTHVSQSRQVLHPLSIHDTVVTTIPSTILYNKSPSKQQQQHLQMAPVHSLSIPNTQSKSPTETRSSKSHSPSSTGHSNNYNNTGVNQASYFVDNTHTSSSNFSQRHQHNYNPNMNPSYMNNPNTSPQQQHQHLGQQNVYTNRSRAGSRSPSRDSTPTNVPVHNANTFQPIYSTNNNVHLRSQSERSNSGNNSGNNSASSSFGGYNGGTSMFATFMPAVVPTLPYSVSIESHRSSPVLPPEEVRS